jgi:hypothetical protein
MENVKESKKMQNRSSKRCNFDSSLVESILHVINQSGKKEESNKEKLRDNWPVIPLVSETGATLWSDRGLSSICTLQNCKERVVNASCVRCAEFESSLCSLHQSNDLHESQSSNESKERKAHSNESLPANQYAKVRQWATLVAAAAQRVLRREQASHSAQRIRKAQLWHSQLPETMAIFFARIPACFLLAHVSTDFWVKPIDTWALLLIKLEEESKEEALKNRINQMLDPAQVLKALDPNAKIYEKCRFCHQMSATTQGGPETMRSLDEAERYRMVCTRTECAKTWRT